MHHSTFHFTCFLESYPCSFSTPKVVKLSHQYDTRANRQRKMEDLEQENHELRGEVATLRVEMEKLTALVESLVAVQNQPSTTAAEI